MDEDQETNCSRSSFKAVLRDNRLLGLPCSCMAVSSAYWKQGSWILPWSSLTRQGLELILVVLQKSLISVLKFYSRPEGDQNAHKILQHQNKGLVITLKWPFARKRFISSSSLNLDCTSITCQCWILVYEQMQLMYCPFAQKILTFS